MIYGYAQICKDEVESETCSNYGSIPNIETYNNVIYSLYEITFGNDLISSENTDKVDPIMTYILIALYVGITVLVTVNIFIAMLTHTFNRVYQSSKAYFVFQRANEIIRRENNMNEKIRHKHLNKVRMDCIDSNYSVLNPFELKRGKNEENDLIKKSIKETEQDIQKLNENVNDLFSEIQEKFSSLEKNAQECTQVLTPILQGKDEYSQSNESRGTNNQIDILEKDFDELKKLIVDYIEKQEAEKNFNFDRK